jgi:AcrR family transcriptional regulator
MRLRCKGKKSEAQTDEIKRQILLVARKHFALQGYEGASLKAIAAEADVAGSLLNYHYNGKEGLFKACTEIFAYGRLEAINRILAEPKSREDMRVRLEIFVEEMLVSIVADPYGFDIIDREMRSGNERVLQLFHDTLLQAFKNVVKFFAQAQDNGLMKPGYDPLIVAILLFNSTCDSARKDFLAKKFFDISFEDRDWRKKFVEHVVALFMNGVIA